MQGQEEMPKERSVGWGWSPGQCGTGQGAEGDQTWARKGWGYEKGFPAGRWGQMGHPGVGSRMNRAAIPQKRNWIPSSS